MIPNEERAGNMPVPQKPAPVHERRKPHGPKPGKGQYPEMPFPVSAIEGERQDFLRQPTIQLFELGLIAHVTQVIIDNGHVANPCGNSLFGELHREPGTSQRLAQAPKFTTLATESVAEQIA